MSDNQSENSQTWRCPETVSVTGAEAELLAAEIAVRETEEAIWRAEEAFEEAKRAHIRAKGFLIFVKNRPTWKGILVPGVNMNHNMLYTACMQLGYGFVLWNGEVYAVGMPGEQLMPTGVKEADIK